MGNPRRGSNFKSSLPELDDLTEYKLDEKKRLIYALNGIGVTEYQYLGNDPHPDIIINYSINDPTTYGVREFDSQSWDTPFKSSYYVNGELSRVIYAFRNQFDATVNTVNSDGEKIYAKEFFNEPGSLKNKVQAWNDTPGDGVWDRVRIDYFEIYGGGYNGNEKGAYSEYLYDVPFGTISEFI